MSTNHKTEGSVNIPPLEDRQIEVREDDTILTSVPALSPYWAPPSKRKWIEFYLPDPSVEDALEWEMAMDVLVSDLCWLLGLSHYRFWSSVVHTPAINRTILTSFLKKAPRFYDLSYEAYESRTRIWTRYKELYVLYFRVFLRLSTYKESSEDYITPSIWSRLLRENNLMSLTTLQTLCTLYESKENPLFAKMVANVVKHDDRMMKELEEQMSVLMDKLQSLAEQTDALIARENWDERMFEDIVCFTLDAFFSILKFLKAYPTAAHNLLHYPGFLMGLALSYETNVHRCANILIHLPTLKNCVDLCKMATLRLFRITLVAPTIDVVESANDSRLDDYFKFYSDCIDEKMFIHDYEKNYPFKADMQSLLSRGIFVDETRIDYMANAISSCFHSCGEDYSVEKIVVDPLYDPNFDRQLLGACSLDISGIELESLISQVKDLLPDLPDSYIEAVLKHYGYKTETAINALLEGGVPARLEKYKSEDYIRSQATPTPRPEETEQDSLPVKAGTFLQPKQHRTEQQTKLDEETRNRIINRVKEMKDADEDKGNGSSYIDRSLLPPQFVTSDVDYDDEYDDTYDDVGAGLTEPDNTTIKPLNVRKAERMEDGEGGDEEEAPPVNRNFDAFCEDPAIIRAKLEQKRDAKTNHNHNWHPPQNHDVVGRSKGQGQDKEVLYNRRQKNIHKGGGGNFKKRSDFKRKEF